MSISLDLNESDYEVRTLTLDGITIRFRAIEDRVYVKHPVDAEHQKLNLYVPEEYYEGKTIHGYTGKTVPIFFSNASGAYASGPADRPGPSFRLWAKGKPNGLFYALAAGFVVAAPGSRGRTVTDEKGRFLGCAPAHIVNLKAAVRYLRHNRDRILGDPERIISNGTSAGGALSALLGTSGNSPVFEPYLKELGAAEERDDVYAASCFTPVMNLEHSDMAYEWMFHGVNHYELHIVKNVGGELQESWVKGDMTEEQQRESDVLVARFADYVNGLGLKDENGRELTLKEDGGGSFRDYVTGFVMASAQKTLDEGADLSSMPWITVEHGRVTALDLAAHARYATRMKQFPAFDQWDLGSPEDELFGTADTRFQHFTQYGKEHSAVDGGLADPAVVAMMNPMTFVEDRACRHWRGRFGTLDRDTSMAISAIFAAALRRIGVEVDYAMPWEVPHAGDYELDRLFAWIRDIC